MKKIFISIFIIFLFVGNSPASSITDSNYGQILLFTEKSTRLDENLQSVQKSFFIPSSKIVLKANLILDYQLKTSKEKNLTLNVRLNGENLGGINLIPDEHPHQVSYHLPAAIFLPENSISLGIFTPKYHDSLKPLPGQVRLKIFRRPHISYVFAVSSIIPKITEVPSLFVGDAGNETPISIVFPKKPSSEEMELSTIFASWIGSCKRFTPLSFRVMNGNLPSEGNAVVFHYRGDVFEKNLPESRGMNIVRNPKDPGGFFLVISGDQYSDLLSLSRSMAHRYQNQRERCLPITSSPVYAWIDQHKVSPLSMLTHPSNLSTYGFPPAPINIDFELPPNLLTWNADGILLHYRFIYSLPYLNANLALLIKVNKHTIYYRRLKSGPHGKLQDLPLEKDLMIPFYDLGRLNRVSFEIVNKNGVVPFKSRHIYSQTRFTLDPNSTIRFQGSRPVAFLPDLCLWLHWGYPFTRYPDLSRTTVFLDPKDSDGVMSQYLDIMGRWGQVTGIVPSKMKVTFSQKDIPADRDLLVLGSVAWARAHKKVFGNLPVTWEKNRVFPDPTLTQKIRLVFDRLLSFKSIRPVMNIHRKARLLPPADLTIFSYPAPWKPDKSIVAVLWKGPVKWNDPFLKILDKKRTEGQDRNSWIYAVFHGKKVDVTDMSTISRHSVGKWGLFDRIEFDLSNYEALLLIMGGLGVCFLWFQADLIRKKQLKKRMRDNHESI